MFGKSYIIDGHGFFLDKGKMFFYTDTRHISL